MPKDILSKDITIFISYSPRDKKLCEKLQDHLSSLIRVKSIEVWSHEKILIGAVREPEIRHYLSTAQIILLLISANFMASDYHHDIEMKQALERHEAGSASVIPILLKPTFLKDALFEKLQKLPSNGEPVSTWRNRDAAFADIVEGVNKAIAGEEIYGSISISISYMLPDFKRDAPPIIHFYGRSKELADVEHWIVTERCQLVAVVGMGGLGKSYLAARLAERLEEQFEYAFWGDLF